jgi:creatinine amidohydrolase/Fe(II)-dependent formamide hydrolase-like protein
VAEQLGIALVYPILPFAPTGDRTKKTEHMQFPGTVSLSDATFGAVAREVALSAIAAGFKNVVLMGDHEGGQDALDQVATELNQEWSPKGVRVYYIPDAYHESRELVRDYLVEHGLPVDRHAGIHQTSEVMFLDKEHKWIRNEKLAPGEWKTGVLGDPRQASAELGKLFLEIKINSAVSQIKSLVNASR